MIFFTWLRDQVRQAVLAGVSDAAAELGEQPEDTAAALTALTALTNSRTTRLPYLASHQRRPQRACADRVSRRMRPLRFGIHSFGDAVAGQRVR